MVELDVLGSPRLRLHDGRAPGSVLRQPKRLALLSYLAVARPGAFVRRDTLVGVFWPESTEERARASLAEGLARLRKSLGAEVVEPRGTGEVRIDPAHLTCDAVAFRTACDRQEWMKAAELYQGPLLEGFILGGAQEFDDWLDRARARLGRLALDALGHVTDAAMQAGDHSARSWAERAFELAPLDDGALHRLMLVLVTDGHCAAAHAIYDDFVKRLAEAGHGEPSAETVETARRILEDELGSIPESKTTAPSHALGDDGASLIEELIHLFQEHRKRGPREFFVDHVEPMYAELMVIHRDYLEALDELRAQVDGQNADQVIALVRARRARLAPVRGKVQALAQATRGGSATVPAEVAAFAVRCTGYFLAGTDMKSSNGRGNSRFTSLVETLQIAQLEHDNPNGGVQHVMEQWLETSRLSLEEGWRTLSDAYATARVNLMR